MEEPSAEAFLAAWLPRLLGEATTFTIHPFQGKSDLLANLQSRLRGYAKWLPDTARILVLVDRDDADCRILKARMEEAAGAAGLPTRTTGAGQQWRVVNRIVVEELEAWYFGAWESVRRVYPRLPANAIRKAALRQCDQIAGGTWEALDRVMRKAGYFAGGLRKVEAAQAIGSVFEPEECNSPSFAVFHAALLEAVQ